MADFVHLHTHTEFSLLDGLSSVKALATYAKELGMSALAITDHGAMFGIVDFYKACKAAEIKPIIGVEAYIAQNSRFDRDHNEKPYHLILLAQNQAGYQNLLKLVSIAQLEGFYYKPRIDKAVLAQYSEGLIVLTACAQGEIPQLLFQGQIDQARETIRWYQAHFPDRFYFELQSHDIPEFEPVYRQMIELGREMGVPLVATNDIHYARREQADAHDVLLCIGTGKTVNESNRMRMTDPSYYMRSPEEMARLYAHLPEALENTVKIAEQCNVEIKFAPPYHLPKFPVPEGRGNSETFLRELCYQGLVRRYGAARAQEPEVVERLEYELGIIHTMGFDDYFLIVWDLCEAAKARDIWWNVRGSGAGSVVAYSLGITSVDPFKNRLLFERFLNPDRISMPDIDLDYPDDRREELISYTAERYGADRVAAIITFGTLGARAAIRDVGRALDIPLNEVDRAARLIPNVPGKPVSIAQALEEVSDLKELYDTIPYVKKLLDTAMEVEGVTRHASTHAAGIIISDRPLVEYMPLHRPTKGEGEGPIGIVSQWPMEIVDMLGMLKVDFLGLRTLTHVRKTCEWIEKEHGRVLTMNTIPYERVPDDPEQDADVLKLYELLTSGETTGVFQVEGSGMRRILRDMRPNQFQHIIAVLALYRPGPMENIPSYIRRMHGEEEVQYHHPILADILDDTYGICVTGDALVVDIHTGERIRLDEVGDRLRNAHQELYVQGIDEEWRMAAGRVTHWVHKGRQPVWEVRLRTGARIKTTADHRYLTENGWKPLNALAVGDYIATPRALMCQNATYDRRKLRLLAYLLADGDLSNLASVNFVSKDPVLLTEYETCLEVFENITPRRVEQVRGVTRVTVAKSDRHDYHAPNALLAWLRELGLKHPAGSKPAGVRSSEKFIPDFVFALSPEDIAYFLASLWDCDGYAGRKLWHYKTISAKLAADVQMLLLKLGIPSYIYTATYKGRQSERTSYQVTVYETARLAEALRPHLLTAKRDVPAVACGQNGISRASFIAEVEAVTALSKRALMQRYGIDRQHFYPKGRQRERIAATVVAPLTEQLNLPETTRRLRIAWEEIVSIEPVGTEDVYDITVEGLHNFVANNIIVHNCVYQEQIMQIAVAMAGYKPGEADGIRKAVAKKVRYLMDKHKQMFLEGALKKGIPEEVSEKVWADIEFFARYGFNRAHATDYAVITAQTAYLKAHYPLEFMTALMTTERHNIEKLGFLIAEARRSGLEVLRPCINRSEVEFTIEHTPEGRAIRIGLGAIKNVGDEVMQLVVDARRERGPFKTLDDFADRVDLRKLNRKALECLIQAGALDDFGSRPALLTLIDTLIGASGQLHSARDVGQFSLFDAMPGATQTIKPPSFVPAIPERRLLEWEKELLGTYLSRHPLAQQESELLRQDLVNTTVDRLATEPLGQQLTLVGMIQRVRRIATKKGDTMAFVTLEGSGGTVDVTVFPRVYERFKDKFVVENIVVVSGKLDNRQDREEHSLLADWFKEPHELLRPVGNTGYSTMPYDAPHFVAEASEFYGTEPDFADDFPPTTLNGNGIEPRTRTTPPAVPPSPPAPSSKPVTAPLSNRHPAKTSTANGGNGARHDTPPPPEEPPPPPATVYVTLPRTGDPSQDFARLAQLHTLLKAESGQDQFVVYFENERGKRVELLFPNERTRFTPHLKEQVAGLVGAENIRVMGSW
ncbi:MAG: DNA polymerase III subunit alpha [Anaerolineae bacterium]